MPGKNKKIRIDKTKKASPRKGLSQHLAETDSAYFLKLVIVLLLGTFWLKFASPVSWNGIVMNAFPLGLIIGLILIYKFEKIQEDRKIWYAFLIVVTLVCYFRPAGISI